MELGRMEEGMGGFLTSTSSKLFNTRSILSALSTLYPYCTQPITREGSSAYILYSLCYKLKKTWQAPLSKEQESV